MPLARLVEWVAGVPASLPAEMRPMAENICQSFQDVAKRLMDLGLEAGANGGRVVAQGTIAQVSKNEVSQKAA